MVIIVLLSILVPTQEINYFLATYLSYLTSATSENSINPIPQIFFSMPPLQIIYQILSNFKKVPKQIPLSGLASCILLSRYLKCCILGTSPLYRFSISNNGMKNALLFKVPTKQPTPYQELPSHQANVVPESPSAI